MTDAELARRLEVASELAREAGKRAHEAFLDPARLRFKFKGTQDVLSETDREVEAMIVARLSAEFPGDSILGEEGGGRIGARAWIIDPIDGTANFVRGIPYYCVSIAFVTDGKAEIGAIYDPSADHLFTARRGHGAWRNGAPIRVSGCAAFAQATIGSGFSYRTAIKPYTAAIETLLSAHCEYRRLGSGALMMAQVADGRYDGYFELHINAWDILAGLVLVREAGGWTNDFLAGEGLSKGNPILACTPALRDQLSEATGIR